VPARLVSLDGKPNIPLDRAVLLVGRHLRCDARIDSLRVSRLHCCLAWHHGGLNVRDLGSTNGTRINGRPAEAGRLQAGDELSIAHLRYRLEDDQGPEVTSISPSAGEQDIAPPHDLAAG
jgi:pSer/pThr/pTyr-binding forkhead associated (FHA) protein